MIDPAAFAALLCDYCLRPEPDEQVVVRSTTLAAPLLLELQRALLEREAWPLLRVSLPGQERGFWDAARDRHLDGFPAVELAEAEGTAASLAIHAPENTRALAGVDPARTARAARAREPVREAALRRRWCVTVWPTPAAAQQAGMATEDFAAFVRRALFLDRDDPIAAWHELRDRQAALVERLSRAQRDPDRGRRHRPDALGRRPHLDQLRRPPQHALRRDLHRPGRDLRRGPHPLRRPRPAPVASRSPASTSSSARAVVVSARADRGDDVLQAALDTDDGARRLGELGIGTNFGIDRPVSQILFDEKIGGTVHLALGRSYPETGGTNESALHWDMICDLRDGGRITADGEPVDVSPEAQREP